ncbi:collagen adhesion protein [Erysipelothrix rhusiopathiae SY1027]|uniref:SpaA isopeptide-forming pilin-related protein n=1 Tax=Erysipelothrix rhusiopathiae TaxID=1648 RepID=UPI000334876F|nr:SpaA isopeptide-forming pilin-related protein [Erysipelothrix rhusiopathiae]AGN24536.1 collagen adhesion protein [Erysipelothrix rhusiopathiae SY1027]
MNLNSIKNFKKKSILLATIFAMILTVFNLRTITANASTVDVVVGRDYYVTYDFERTPNHPNYHPSYKYYDWHWGDLTVGGQIVYCLDPETKIPSPNGYTASNWNDYTKAQQDRMILIANYGAGYNGENSAKMRFASQVLIWEVVGWNVKNLRAFNGGSFDISKEIAIINSRVASHTARPSFHNTTRKVKVGETFTLTDSTLSTYDINSLPSGLKLVDKSANSITLKVTSREINDGTLSLIKKSANKKGVSIVYKKAGNQTFAMFQNDDPIYASLRFELSFGHIEIAKTDANGDFVKNAVFELSKNKNTILGTYTTDSSGKVRINDLEEDTYYIREKSVPSPLVLDSSWKEVNVKAGETSSFTATNKFQRSDLTLNKIENSWDTLQPQYNNIKLSDAVIELYAKNDIYEGKKLIYRSGDLIGKEVTNAAGQVKFHNLPLGEYFAKETIAPKGYILHDGVWNISLKYDNGKLTTELTTTESTLSNQIAHGKAKLHKTSKGGSEFLENAVFGLFTKDGEKLGEFITDKKGEIISPSLRYGSYYWQELKAPTGYYLDNTKHYFDITVEDHEDVIHIPIVNEYIEMKLQIIKTDAETKLPLKDAVFEIYDSENELVSFTYLDDNYETQVQSQLITNDKGIAFTRGNLKYGTYTLVEVEAPKGYIKQEPIKFTIDENTTVIDLPVIGRTKTQDISNQPTTTEVIKLSENTGQPLDGAHLQLIHKKTNKIIFDWISDGEPVTFKGLHVNETYILREVSAPDGYFVSDPIEFVVQETSDLQTISMLNELIPEIKTQAFYEDGDKVNLANEKITVIDTVNYKGLVLGQEYTIKGKLLTTDTQEIVSETEFSFIAEKPDGTLEISFDFDGSLLYGKTLVVFEDLYRGERLVATHSELTDKKQTVYIPKIKTSASTLDYTSESKGFITINDVIHFEGLEPGKEYTAVGWLMLNENTELVNEDNERYESLKSFRPTQSSGTVEVSFEIPIDTLSKGDLVIFEELYFKDKLIAEHKDINDADQTVSFVEIIIKKIDSDTKATLKGVEFTLYDVNGKPIQSLTTNEHGTVRFLVTRGQYHIQETKALDGYISNNKKYPFTILGNEDNHEVILELENKLIPELPKTGIGVTTNEIIAVTLLSTGGLLIFLHFRKRKSEYEKEKY